MLVMNAIFAMGRRPITGARKAAASRPPSRLPTPQAADDRYPPPRFLVLHCRPPEARCAVRADRQSGHLLS